MLIGQYQHAIDAKNRIIIPSKFREELGDVFVVTKGLDNCLFVYSNTEWQKVDEKLKNLSMTNKDARAFTRFFYAGACECEIDKQGRIIIPNNLREHAKIEKDIIIVGVSSKVEIWSAEEWERFNSESNLSYEEAAENLIQIVI